MLEGTRAARQSGRRCSPDLDDGALDLRYLITDLFETITLYDNKAVSATYCQTRPGHYHVTLTVDAKKVRSTGAGVETSVPLHDAIDIGIFADQKGSDPGKPLILEKRVITGPHTTFTYDVTEKPTRAGIDPYNKLIDRVPDDNVMTVTAE